MSLTCYCPRCTSAFLVSEQQLGEAQGWVRCGICQEVFIAQAHTVAPNQTLVTEPPQPQPPEVLPPDEPRLEAESFQEPPSTVETTKAQSPDPRPPESRHKGRWGWFAVSTLTVLLAVQIGLHEVGFLANTAPKAISRLQSLCPTGRCGIQKLAAISIDDSSFTVTGPSLFHLQALIGNRSDLALEAPVLALTLTDSSDRVVARKNYRPQEWGAATATLSGTTASPLSLWLEWEAPAGGPRVVGYRLQAFYP